MGKRVIVSLEPCFLPLQILYKVYDYDQNKILMNDLKS